MISLTACITSGALVPFTFSQWPDELLALPQQPCLTRPSCQSMITLTIRVKRHFVHLGTEWRRRRMVSCYYAAESVQTECVESIMRA